MEFRLVYDGRLPAASQSDTRVADKDRIRRVLSKQLAELFATHPALRQFGRKEITREVALPHASEAAIAFMEPDKSYSMIELMARSFERCKRGYVPLINSRYATACALDILFLRRDQPGNVIMSGGDLDNRIKVLFDALRLPQNCDEVVHSPDDDPSEPIFVLLEDDRLIVDVKIVSDRLLTPRRDEEHVNDVRLVIHVKTLIDDPSHLAARVFG